MKKTKWDKTEKEWNNFLKSAITSDKINLKSETPEMSLFKRVIFSLKLFFYEYKRVIVWFFVLLSSSLILSASFYFLELNLIFQIADFFIRLISFAVDFIWIVVKLIKVLEDTMVMSIIKILVIVFLFFISFLIANLFVFEIFKLNKNNKEARL